MKHLSITNLTSPFKQGQRERLAALLTFQLSVSVVGASISPIPLSSPPSLPPSISLLRGSGSLRWCTDDLIDSMPLCSPQLFLLSEILMDVITSSLTLWQSIFWQVLLFVVWLQSFENSAELSIMVISSFSELLAKFRSGNLFSSKCSKNALSAPALLITGLLSLDEVVAEELGLSPCFSIWSLRDWKIIILGLPSESTGGETLFSEAERGRNGYVSSHLGSSEWDLVIQ